MILNFSQVINQNLASLSGSKDDFFLLIFKDSHYLDSWTHLFFVIFRPYINPQLLSLLSLWLPKCFIWLWQVCSSLESEKKFIVIILEDIYQCLNFNRSKIIYTFSIKYSIFINFHANAQYCYSASYPLGRNLDLPPLT